MFKDGFWFHLSERPDIFDNIKTEEITLESLEDKEISYEPTKEDGYYINENLSIFSGKVSLDGSLVLKVYYESNYVKNVIKVNDTEIDMSDVIKYIDNDDEPAIGYYNYHLTNQTVTNLCNTKHSITDSTRKVLYLNKILSGSYSFEVTIDMSSLDSETNSSYARQGIVLSNGSVELAIFPANWTSGNAQNNTLVSGNGAWYFHNGTTGEFVTDAGKHDGVGKCVSTNFASEITLKVEKISNTHINLYANGALITVLKADGIYSADGTKSAKTLFNDSITALLSSEEMVVGFNHFNALNFPGAIYKDIKFEELYGEYTVEYYFDGKLDDSKTVVGTKYIGETVSITPEEVSDYTLLENTVSGVVNKEGLLLRVDYVTVLVSNTVTVGGKTIDKSSVINYVYPGDSNVNGLYNFNMETQTITNAQVSPVYLSKVMSGSFRFSVTVDATNASGNDAYRAGLVIHSGSNFLKVSAGDAIRTFFDSSNGVWAAGSGDKLSADLPQLTYTIEVDKNNGRINFYIEDVLRLYFDETGGYYRSETDGVVSYKNRDTLSTAAYITSIKALLNADEYICGVWNAFNANNGVVFKDFKFEK